MISAGDAASPIHHVIRQKKGPEHSRLLEQMRPVGFRTLVEGTTWRGLYADPSSRFRRGAGRRSAHL